MFKEYLHYILSNDYLVMAIVSVGTIVVMVVYKLACRFMAALFAFSVRASTVVVRKLRVSAVLLLTLICSLLVSAALLVAQPFESCSTKAVKALKEYSRLLRLHWKLGLKDFGSFAKFKRHAFGEEEPHGEQREHGPLKGSYEEAQAIMGFTGNAPVCLKDLKARYRQLISLVHPDKGCPSTVFAQQINGAMETIKASRRWK